ncbi:MAG: hypothetical protein Fur0010_20310 [Bdellovibrio sp.]
MKLIFTAAIMLFGFGLEAKEEKKLPYDASEEYVLEGKTYYKVKNQWFYMDKERGLQSYSSDPNDSPKGHEYYKVDGKYLFKIINDKCFFRSTEFNCSKSSGCDNLSTCSITRIKFENGVESLRELYDLFESNPSETIADAPFKPDPKNVRIRFQGEILPGPEDAVEYNEMFLAQGIELLHRRGKRYYQSNKKLQEFLKKLDKCIEKKGKECEYLNFEGDPFIKKEYDKKAMKQVHKLVKSPMKYLTHNYNHGIGLAFDGYDMMKTEDQHNCLLIPNDNDWTLSCHPKSPYYLRYGKPYKDSADPR